MAFPAHNNHNDDFLNPPPVPHTHTTMAGRLDFRNFHEVFGNGDTLPYNQHVNRDIESKRKSLGGVLFVDRVFTALGISKGGCPALWSFERRTER